MHKKLQFSASLLICFFAPTLFAQTNEWATQYVTFDDALNGTGDRTASVAAVGENAFLALVTRLESGTDIFSNLRNNYLVGYVDADSALGRVAAQEYNPTGQFDSWASGLDLVTLSAAWQLAGGKNNYVYVANNDANHNILVFELTALGVVSTDFRMETGSENIYAIDVDTSGYVIVVDYEGTDAKSNEVKVYAPIGAEGTTWGEVGGHNDAPLATIDLAPGTYQGVAAAGNATAIYVSASTERKILKFIGDPVNGYTQDMNFDVALAPDDTIGNGGSGTPTFLGLDYLDEADALFAAADDFLNSGSSGGYPYGRIYVINASEGAIVDTVDIAEWNLALTGDYSSGSSNGRAGGFTSVYDVDATNEPAVYSQTYYGWAVEKWVFDGDLPTFVSVRQLSTKVPEKYSLAQNYPNPFNPRTTIGFEIKTTEHVRLQIYDLMGRKLVTLIDQQLAPGAYTASFDAGRLPSGVYFYTLEAGTFKATRKMLLAK